jgi:YbbR domain-containing protein
MKSSLLRGLTNNLGWKLGSLAFAFLLWLTVVAQPEMTTVQTVPVLYKNIRPDLALSSGAPQEVHVELRGIATTLSRGNLSDAVVTLDLAETGASAPRTFHLSANELRLPQGITFVRAMPPEVVVRLTTLKTKPDNQN